MKKTILSIAISCALSASVLAATETTTATSSTTTTQSTSTTTPPPPCPVGQTCPPAPAKTTGTQAAATQPTNTSATSGSTTTPTTSSNSTTPSTNTSTTSSETTKPATTTSSSTTTTQPTTTSTTSTATTTSTSGSTTNSTLQSLGIDDNKLASLGRDDVAKLPAKALQALDKKSLAAMPIAALKGLTTAALQQLKADEVKQLDSKDLTKLITNLDPTQVKVDDVKALLPAGWTVDASGKITPPAGSTVTLPTVSATQTTPTNLTTPAVADLTQGVAIGGKTDAASTVLQGINDALKAAGIAGFVVTQGTDGVITVAGNGVKLTFLPDSDNVKQGDSKEAAGLTKDDKGHFVVVTATGLNVPVIPTLKDPKGLALALGKDASVKVDASGVVSIAQTANGKKKIAPVVIDSLATPSTGTPVAGKPAGVYFIDKETGYSVAADGTAQAIKPAIAAPDTFTAKAQAFSGVQAVQSNGDGSFTVNYKGTSLTIKPESFDTTVSTATTGQTVDASITIQDNKLVYTYQDGTDVVSQTLTAK